MKTQKVQCFSAAALLMSFFFAIRADAQITPIGDAYTNSATPTTNYGAKTLLDVDAASQISYIQFDLASIPSGAGVSQATLKLYVNSILTAGSFNVDYVNGGWTEGTINSSNAPALGSTIAGSVEITTADKNQYILINITPALQAWLNGSEANNGIALVANGSFNATFDSKENTTTSHPPELDVVLAGGGGGTLTGVLTASGSGLVGGGTSGTLNLTLLNTCAAGQVLQWNGSSWGCASAGIGTVTSVGSGAGLTGGPITGSGTLSVDPSQVPFLAAANTFTGSQAVNGNLSATGLVTGTGFNIGSNLFAFGSYSNANAFLGFAGNTTMTGFGNTASGIGALFSNTTGGFNTASGAYALGPNTTGYYNTATGGLALQANTTGYYNTATGGLALSFNTTGASNTASGASALYNNTTGSANTASGVFALLSNTTGSNNDASGWYALGSNTTGINNSARGSGALASNTTGSGSTASGAYALYYSTTAIQNTADGSFALENNSTGSYNTATGSGALLSNTTGMFETAHGFGAGGTKDNSNITGQNNTFLGAYTKLSAGSLSNATAIGSNAEVDASNALVLGSINGVNGATASTNVGIGTTTPASTLDVHGTGNFTGLVTFAPNQTFSGAGTVTSVGSGSGLTGGPITGSGTLSIASGGVSNAMLANSSLTVNPGTGLIGGGPVSLGGGTMLNVDPAQVPFLAAANTFTANQTVNGNLSVTGVLSGAGYQIGSNLFDWGSYASGNAFIGFAGNPNLTTGRFNTGTGVAALASITDGGYNTAAGNKALYSNTDGSYNTATGGNALSLNTTGSANTATGMTALTNNTTGSNNTATGDGALANNVTGANNTASGVSTLQSNSGGNYNTAEGEGALAANSTGSNNTALGGSAGAGNVVGSQNTFVGYGADASLAKLTNATAIGANAIVSESNAVVLGGTGANAVNVGIGTATPAYTLDVQGTGNFTGVVNFSPKQTFPNTISGVTTAAGSGLMGGGNSGNLNLSLVNSCANGQVLVWNGSAWACTNLSGDGTVTSVGSGTGLTGGPITTSGTLAIDTTVVPQLNVANTFTATQTANAPSPANYGFRGITNISSGIAAAGVYGQTATSTGSGLAGVGVWGDTGLPGTPGNSHAGVLGTAFDANGGYFVNSSTTNYSLVVANFQVGPTFVAYNRGDAGCNIDASGNLNCTGAKNAVVPLDGGKRKVALSAIESPENWFEDFGSAQLVNGAATIALDPDFIQTVNTEKEYNVFLTLYGDCKGLYVANRTESSFEVHELGGGTANVSFGYRITAIRRKYETVRFADHTNDPVPPKMLKLQQR